MLVPPLAKQRCGALARVVGAVGCVGAAGLAHHSAGAPLPSPLLLVALTVLLALGALRAPRRLRSGRLQLAIGALLQPVLHIAFAVLPGVGPRPTSFDGMLLAHLLAAVLAGWWWARGADRLVELAGGTVQELAAVVDRWRQLPAPAPLPSTSVLRRVGFRAPSRPLGRGPVSAVPRRGPPVVTSPC